MQQPSSRIHVVALVAVALCVAHRSSGQATPGVRPAQIATCGADSVGFGRISGRFVADSTGIAVGALSVVARQGLDSPACVSGSDKLGEFTIRGLPPGDYVVTTSRRYAALYPAAPLHVARDSTTTLTIHLAPQNRVRECKLVAECIRLIEPDAAALTLSDTDQVREAAFRGALAVNAGMWLRMQAPLPHGRWCLGITNRLTPPSAEVLAALRPRFPQVTGVTSCPQGSFSTPINAPDPYAVILLRSIRIEGNHAAATGSNSEGLWEITFERQPTGWRATSFRMLAYA